MIRRPRRLYDDITGTLAYFGVPLTPTAECVRPVNARVHANGYYELVFMRRRTYLHSLGLRFRLKRDPRPGLQVRHLCGHKWCVNPWHLTEGTAVDNMRDQYSHGTRVMGERHPMAKLSEAGLIQVREQMALGESDRQIAQSFGLCRAYVNEIRRGAARAHPAVLVT